MADSWNELGEIALIDLSFALAEIHMLNASSPSLQRAAEHIEQAMMRIKCLAPSFDSRSEKRSET